MKKPVVRRGNDRPFYGSRRQLKTGVSFDNVCNSYQKLQGLSPMCSAQTPKVMFFQATRSRPACSMMPASVC